MTSFKDVANWAKSQALFTEETIHAEEGLPETAAPRLILLSNVEAEEVDWLWPGYIPLGKIAILAGDPGLGNSWAALDIGSRLTVGGETPDHQHRMEAGPVLLLTAEDGLADTVRPRLDVQGGDASLVHVLDGFTDPDGHKRLPSLPGDIAELETAMVTTRARLMIIDPLNAFTGRTNSNTDAQVRQTLTPLSKMAERTGAAVVVVLHLNKDALKSALHRVQGSVGYVAAARSVLLVVDDKDNPGRRVMAPIKANLAGKMPSMAFTITEEPALVWQGVVEVDIDELLAKDSTEGRVRRREAKDFLYSILNDGEVPSKDVVAEGLKQGITYKTLSRASKEIGVVSTHVGEPGKKGGGHWIWRLPTEQDGQGALHGESGHLDKSGHLAGGNEA